MDTVQHARVSGGNDNAHCNRYQVLLCYTLDVSLTSVLKVLGTVGGASRLVVQTCVIRITQCPSHTMRSKRHLAEENTPNYRRA